MKENLLKGTSACLQAVIAFAITAIFSSVSTNAQIVYTDLIPNDTIACYDGLPSTCMDLAHVDLDNDGSIDFTITYHQAILGNCPMGVDSHEISTDVSTNGANVFYGIVSSNPSALNEDDIIDSNLNWSNGTDTLSYTSYQCKQMCPPYYGNWMPDTYDYYLPFRISISGNNHFGWIRMQMTFEWPANFYGFVLKDFAYNSIPDQAILAGQTDPTGINENSFTSSINLFPNPAANHLTIDVGSNNQKIAVCIIDISGKIIYSTTSSGTKKIEVNNIDFADGIYLVHIQSADFTETKKLIIVK